VTPFRLFALSGHRCPIRKLLLVSFLKVEGIKAGVTPELGAALLHRSFPMENWLSPLLTFGFVRACWRLFTTVFNGYDSPAPLPHPSPSLCTIPPSPTLPLLLCPLLSIAPLIPPALSLPLLCPLVPSPLSTSVSVMLNWLLPELQVYIHTDISPHTQLTTP